MELTAVYIWSQIFTVIEYGLLGLSYLAKKRKLVVILDIASMACGIVAFILLGADLGVGMSIVILLANFYYLWQEDQKKLRKKRFWWDYLMLGVILAVIVVITIFTNEGWLSLLSVLATVLYEISIWQKSPKIYKLLGIPVAGSWMLYNGVIGSPAGVVCEFVMLIASTYGYIKAYKADKIRERRRLARQKREQKKAKRSNKAKESKGKRS